MKQVVQRFLRGDTVISCHWTPDEIRQGWRDYTGQGNREARQMGNHCVVIKCSEYQALCLTAMFLDEFAIRSCVWYDDKTGILSMFCGHTGHENVKNLCARIWRMVGSYMSGDIGTDQAERNLVIEEAPRAS